MNKFNRRGSAMLLGLGTMMVLGLLLAALLPWITAEARFSTMEKAGLEARYAAEAGIKKAILQLPSSIGTLSSTPDWIRVPTAYGDPSIETLDVNKKKYLIDIMNADGVTPANFPLGSGGMGNQFVVISTGTVGSVSRVAKLMVTVTAGSGGAAMYSEGDITLPKAGQPFLIDGTLATSGVFCDGQKCGTEASPNVTCTTVTPCLSPGAPHLTIPPFPAYNSATMTLGIPAPVDHVVTLVGGTTYYVNSSWSDQNNITYTTTGPVKIYVNGEVNLGNSQQFGSVGPNAAILIQSTGDIIVKNTSNSSDNQFDGVGLISNGKVDLQNNSYVKGFIMAGDNLTVANDPNTTEVGNNGKITFDAQTAVNLGLSGAIGYTAATWDMTTSLWSR